jgi:hypothetical protein
MTRSRRTSAAIMTLVMAGVVGHAIRAAGQEPARREATARPVSTYVPPRTADGHPDLEGIWTNGTLTPFERPAELAGKAFLTEAEAAEIERRAVDRRANRSSARPGDVGSDNEAFVDSGYKLASTRQTSLVVDPPDGRVPFLPETERRRQFNLTSVDSYETMSPWDRCITRGATGLFPAGYNNGYQIFQTRTHVVVLAEMIHEARIIPLDGRPHIPSSLGQWSGDSRGRWDGNTLVVDTTNFHDRGWFSTHAGSGRLRGTPLTSSLRLVERFTRISEDTLIYEMRIEDPEIYERPWTVSIPMTRNDGYQIFEYACHEGNKATELILRGARTLEREAAAGGKDPR